MGNPTDDPYADIPQDLFEFLERGDQIVRGEIPAEPIYDANTLCMSCRPIYNRSCETIAKFKKHVLMHTRCQRVGCHGLRSNFTNCTEAKYEDKLKNKINKTLAKIKRKGSSPRFDTQLEERRKHLQQFQQYIEERNAGQPFGSYINGAYFKHLKYLDY